MIADALFERMKELDGFLNDRAFDHITNGEIRTEICELRDYMEKLGIKLNTPFHWKGPEKSRTENRGELNVG
jgi:hypothetical protein